MDILTRKDLNILLNTQKEYCISIYMPTSRTIQTQQNPIRWKNQLHKAEKELAEAGLKPASIKELLQPAKALIKEHMFWQYQGDGLAAFISIDDFMYYRLPYSCSEHVTVSDRYHITPLLPFFNTDGHFYIMALSQNKIRLFRATRDHIDEIDIGASYKIPKNFKESLSSSDNNQEYVQFHTGRPGTAHNGRLAHTHSVGPDDSHHKKELGKFFVKLNSALVTLLKDETAPMVLAGVDFLFSIFMESCKYPHILEEKITGNPDELSPEQLHKKAWNIVAPTFSKKEKIAKEQFYELSGTNKISTDINEIINAAFDGRIQELFIAKGKNIFGFYDQELRKTEISDAQPLKENLTDLAAIITLATGGNVFLSNPDDMPGKAITSAIFRYA